MVSCMNIVLIDVSLSLLCVKAIYDEENLRGETTAVVESVPPLSFALVLGTILGYIAN